TDKVYATTDATLGASRVLLGAFPHHGLLAAGASYSQTQLVPLPVSLSGPYNVFVVADAPITMSEDGGDAHVTGPGGAVYEGDNEANNVAAPLPVAITRKLADLQVTQVTAPADAATGADLTVRWTVANTGDGRTNANYWYDDVYLSTQPTLGSGGRDVYLG